MEPVVGPGAHRDHRAAAGQFGVAGELPRHPRRGRGRHRGDRLLPGRRGRRCRVVVAGRPLAGQPGAGHGVLGQQQVEHRGHQLVPEPDGRHAAADHPAALGLARIEPGQVDRDRVVVPAVESQHRVDPAEVQVPPAPARLGVARGQGAVRHDRLAGRRVQQDGLVRGAAAVQVRGGQEPVRHVAVPAFPQRHQEGKVGVGLHVIGEVGHLPVPEELGQDHVAHRHRQCRVGARRAGQPVVGELGVIGEVRADHHDLLAPVSRLGHEMRVRGAGDRQVRPPDHQVRRVPPVTGLRHVGLVAEHLRGGDRHIRVPVVERQDRPADHRQEPRSGRVGHLRHRRDRGEAHHPVRPVGLDRVHVRRGDELAHLLPVRAHEPALTARPLIPRRPFRVAGDLRPGQHRVPQPGPRLAPHLEQRPPDVRVADPRRRVRVPGKGRSPRAAARLVLRRVRAHRRIVGLLRLPGDDPVLDVHLPRARSGAVHPVGRTHLLVMPPPLPVELLGAPPAPPVQLTIILGRATRREELRPPQQRLDRLTGRQQRSKPTARLGPAAARFVP